MKKILTCLLLLTFICLSGQTNDEIAGVYLKKSEENFGSLKFKEAIANYNKAIKLLDTILKPKVARLGTLINYELQNYDECRKLAKQYFNLETKKTSEEYTELLELYVDVEEKLIAIAEEKKRKEEIRLAKEKELKRIDSLKQVWATKSNLLSFKADSIYTFNKKNTAVVKVDDKFGLINDRGKIIIEPKYNNFLSNDGYILFTNKKENPTKIFCYSLQEGEGYNIQPVIDFNENATHYGTITLPRGNGRLAMYPNNSLKTLIFDIEAKKFVKIANLKVLLKALKKNDRIDKYDEDERKVRVNKKWYGFGSHLGGGVYTLYNIEGKKLYGYLITEIDSEDPVVVKANEYEKLGAFYGGKLQAIKNGKTVWVNKNIEEVKAPKNENGVYTGEIKIEKTKEGKYQFKEKGYIILGSEKLEKLADFLRKNSPNK